MNDKKKTFWYNKHSMEVFYIPVLVIVVLLVYLPLLVGFGYSLTDWDGYSNSMNIVGISNYLSVFKDPNFIKSLVNTIIYTFFIVIIQQPLALLLAARLNCVKKGAGIIRMGLLLPVMVSYIAFGTMYSLMFSYTGGTINDILGTLFGIDPIVWLGGRWSSIAIIVIMSSFQWVGMSTLIYFSGMQQISGELNESANLDGMSSFQKFRYITIPLLQPAFLVNVLLNVIGSFKIYDQIIVLTNGGPGYETQSLSTYIDKTYFANQMAGYASAIGIITFLLIVIVTLIMYRQFMKKEVDLW